MNKTVVACVAILSLAAIICAALYFQSNRYVMVNAGSGKAYKTDRLTGETAKIDFRGERPVERLGNNKPLEPKELAINIAKTSPITFGEGTRETTKSSQAWIDWRTKRAISRGEEIRVIGWDAEPIDDQNFIVAHSFEIDEEIGSLKFLVNTRVHAARQFNSSDPEYDKYNRELEILRERARNQIR